MIRRKAIPKTALHPERVLRTCRKFLDRGGSIVWGIVPTGVEAFEKENFQSLVS